MKKLTLLLLTLFSMFIFGQTNKSIDADHSVKPKPITYKLPTKPALTTYDYYQDFNSQNLTSPKLYNQYEYSPNNINSQQFDAANSAYTSNAADDFEVPAATTWKIESVFVSGRTVVANYPDSFNVTFYNNSATNLPGTVIRTENIVLASGAASPTLQLGSPILLPTGKYWISVQAVMNLISGQWFWDTYTDPGTLGAPYAWTNPGNGFGTSCSTVWNTGSVCLASQLKDLKFSLDGTIATPCKTLTGRIMSTDPTQNGRIFRDAIPSVCATTKAWPGILSVGANIHHKTYSVKNISASPQCMTFTINNADAAQVMLTAYNTTFNPADISQNYMGDTGSSSAASVATTMNIVVPANTTVILVTSEIAATTFAADYSITIFAPNCGDILKTIDSPKEKMSLYPNPTKRTLYVSGMDIKQAKVYDASGKIVPVKNSGNDINVENLPKGTYLIQVEDKGGNVHSDKFIKN